MAIFDDSQIIQEFNNDDYGSSALVLGGTCTKTSLLSSARSNLLRYGNDESGTSAVASLVVVRTSMQFFICLGCFVLVINFYK